MIINISFKLRKGYRINWNFFLYQSKVENVQLSSKCYFIFFHFPFCRTMQQRMKTFSSP